MAQFSHINGSIVDIAQASVSVNDRGLLYGDGLFETVRVRGGRLIRWESHLKRMREGARILILDAPPDDLAPAVLSLCEANHLTDALVRLTLTRGPIESAGQVDVTTGMPSTLIITADLLPNGNQQPARVVASSIRRDEKSPLCRVQSLDYLPSILARAEAERCGVDDAIFANTAGNIAEGTTSNIFMVKHDTLITPSPDQGALQGTVRQALIDIAPSCGFGVEEREIGPDELLDADELFFTNAIGLIRPITEVDGLPIGAETFDVSARLLAVLKELE